MLQSKKSGAPAAWRSLPEWPAPRTGLGPARTKEKFLRRGFSSAGVFHLWPGQRKNITCAAHRLNVVSGVRIPKFLADFAHMHVNTAVKWGELAAQHLIHQRFATDHAPSLPQQNMQQTELDRRQIDRLSLVAN